MNLIKHANMMKCTLEPGEKLNESQFLELCANTQGIFLPCQKAQLNGALTLMYDAKAYNTLESSASHLTAVQFRQVLRELLKMLRAVSQQSQLSSLKMGNLRTEFDKIYVHNDTLRPALVYTPVESDRAFPEDELRAEIAETITANESLRDDGNNEICRYLKSADNDLFGLIDLIPTLRNRTVPVSSAAPVTAQSEAIQRLADDNKRLRRQVQLLLIAVVGVFLLIILLFVVLKGGGGDASAQTTTVPTDTTTAQVLALGDLNGDDTVDTADVALLRDCIDGKSSLREAQRKAADLNNDGLVNSNDLAALILRTSGDGTGGAAK